MTAFADPPAIVKIYADEPGRHSAQVRALLSGQPGATLTGPSTG